MQTVPPPESHAVEVDPAVRKRLVEFLGGDSLKHATAIYITHSDGFGFDRRELRPPAELDWFLERGLDVGRSLADSASLLLHLDVEYVNFDSPAAAFVDPWLAFAIQEPVVKAIESLLLEWGIRPLHIITGQGHHFVWRVGRRSKTARRLTSLAPAPELVGACHDRVPALLKERIDPEAQSAFSAISLILQFVAHRIKEEATALCEVPVEITAVHVGRNAKGHRELVSIDISEYGDPLHTRMIRLPFTNYLKPRANGLARLLGIGPGAPTFWTIPLHEMDVRQALKVRHSTGDVRDLARRACVRIPEQADGTMRLIENYLASRLRLFHEFFYSAKHDPRERWPETYARTPLASLPPCARHVLEWPNDLLLKPAGIQLVCRSLLAEGWHPRHIAGLIRSKYEDPSFNWPIGWNDYEPATRADFYTSLFAGLHAAGLDKLVDFNCTSNREKGFCFMPPGGGCSLENSRQTLLSRQSS
jgi:hypothetical protein